MRLFLCLKKAFSYPIDPPLPIVIPAQAGTQWLRFPVFATEQMPDDSGDNRPQSHWVPACAGMTN
jgi:hypothetical protein